MPDGKPFKYEALSIPSYEEAIAGTSRSGSPLSQSFSDSDREGLLSHEPGGRIPVPTRRADYRPPAVDDAADEQYLSLGPQVRGHSQDSDDDGGSEADVRWEVEEMEILEPSSPSSLSHWGKRISTLSQSLSARIPRSWHWPRLRIVESIRWPSMDANFCILLGRIFALLLVVGLVWLLLMSSAFSSTSKGLMGQLFDPESLRQHVQNGVDGNRIRQKLEMLTNTDHLAGTEGAFVLAEYVKRVFRACGLEGVGLEEWEVYLNFPSEGGRKVELMNGENVMWTAKLEEDVVYSNPPRQQTQVFHAYSRAGDVEGPLIYAASGSRADFKRLYDSGIETNGAIALVRNQGSPADAALKVKAAEMVGFVGCIIYSDPADDGFRLGEVAPDGRYMPEGGVQRGSVGLTNWVVGDPLTPGHASKHGAKRKSTDDNPGLVNIPSLPMSWGDAKNLLLAMQGFGQPCPAEWLGGVPDVEYWTGNLSSPKVHLVNQQDEVKEQKIWNVVGRIQGVEQGEKSIILGARSDSFVFGATNPGSGLAVFLEVVELLGDLVERGWRPLRTIEFASWDGGQYNLVGSTEHVEDNIDQIRKDALAYINLDTAIVGSRFRAAGSPMFKKVLSRVLDRVGDPISKASLRELWDQRGGFIEALGSRSDYVAFQDLAGTSSLDISFDGPPHPVNSAYDTFEYVNTIGDPGFNYHVLLSQVVALLLLELSDRLVLPFDLASYSASIDAWTHDLEAWASSNGVNEDVASVWSTEALREAVSQFKRDASQFENWEDEWDRMILGSGGSESSALESHRKSHNARMGNFETHLLDLGGDGGISNRTQYKHVIHGPQAWSSTLDGQQDHYFPAIRDAVESKDWKLAQDLVDKTAKILKSASRKLVGNG